MSSLFPQEWDNLLNKMLNDINGTLAANLYKYDILFPLKYNNYNFLRQY